MLVLQTERACQACSPTALSSRRSGRVVGLQRETQTLTLRYDFSAMAGVHGCSALLIQKADYNLVLKREVRSCMLTEEHASGIPSGVLGGRCARTRSHSFTAHHWCTAEGEDSALCFTTTHPHHSSSPSTLALTPAPNPNPT